MIVGEAPGSTEELRLLPFIGSSGLELTRMLAEAGIDREKCFITNVCKYRPPSNDISSWFLTKTAARKLNLNCIVGRYPNEQIIEGLEELYLEIDEVKPKVIMALGDTALWALCGESGISKWRGSALSHCGIPVIPTYHPAAILRQWAWRFIAVQDLRRAANAVLKAPQSPIYNFSIRPSYNEAISTISRHISEADSCEAGEKLRLAVDIETRFKHIDCIGYAWTKTHAICLPFLTNQTESRSYFSLEEEVEIVDALRRLLTHPNVQVIGHNWLYDSQYMAKDWGYVAWPYLDTMIAHHVAFAASGGPIEDVKGEMKAKKSTSTIKKSLDWVASLYNDYYLFWKEEGQQENFQYMDMEQHWNYNCKDCVNTFEASYHIEDTISTLGLNGPLDFQMKMFKPVLKSMLRGVATSRTERQNISKELLEAMIDRQNFLNYVLGHEFNPRSSPQMKDTFYNRFGVKPMLHKKTKKPTLAKGALSELRKKADPLLHPLIDAIIEFRRAGTAYSVATVPIDPDGRIRCSYNIAGTETYRLSSSEDAFGYGTNLQNISKGD